jgi:hypothetical protein
MKQTLRMLSLLTLVVAMLLVVGCSAAVDPATADKEIRAKTDELISAWKTNDVAWLKQNLTEGYLFTGQDFNIASKEAIVEFATAEQDDLDATTAIDDWQTTLQGDTVAALYKLSWKFADGSANEVRLTDVWVHSGGQWKLMAQHGSQISLTRSAESLANEKKAVADFVKGCSVGEDLTVEKLAQCLHKDFAAWEQGALTTKEEQEHNFVKFYDYYRLMQPQVLDIKSTVLHGDTAIVHYTISGTSTDAKTGDISPYKANGTDICVKEGNQWRIIGTRLSPAPAD